MVYTRKFKHPEEELLAEGKKIIATDRDSKFLFRVTMVNLILSGIKPSELSNYCGVDERTLSGWVAKADNDGFESLRAVKQTGRPSKLSDEQKEKIKGVIKEDPSIYGYTNWDGSSLSDFISNNDFRVHCTLNQANIGAFSANIVQISCRFVYSRLKSDRWPEPGLDFHVISYRMPADF